MKKKSVQKNGEKINKPNCKSKILNYKTQRKDINLEEKRLSVMMTYIL